MRVLFISWLTFSFAFAGNGNNLPADSADVPHPPADPALAGPPSDAELVEAHSSGPLAAIADDLDHSGAAEAPHQKTPDAFLLGGQSLDYQGLSYDLSSLRLVLPRLVSTEFETEIQTERDPETGDLVFIFYRKGAAVSSAEIARHRFSRIKPVTIARDGELLVVLNEDGTLYAVDMGLARTHAFRAPLPVIRLTSLDDQLKHEPGLTIQWRARTSEPARPVDLNELLVAGNLVITNQSRAVVQTLDRNSIRTAVYGAEAAIAHISPEGIDPLQDGLSLGDWSKDEHVQGLVNSIAQDQSPELKDALYSYSRLSLARLLERAKILKGLTLTRRDAFTYAEWQASFQRDQAATLGQAKQNWRGRAASALGKISIAVPRAIWNGLTENKLKIMAGVIAGAGVYLVGKGEVGPVWATHFLNSLYALAWPNVLSDAAYRVTVAKNMIALESIVGVMYLTGLLESFKRGQNWSATKVLAARGIRAVAETQVWFWHRLATIFRQPNFMAALQNEINPFTQVTADSALGRKLALEDNVIPGLNSVLAKKETIKENSTILEAVAHEKKRLKSLAWTLSLQVTAEKFNIDPVTLGVMIENGDTYLTPKQIETVANSPEFKRHWSDLADELEENLKRLQSEGIEIDLAHLDPSEIEMLTARAEAVAQKISERSEWAQKLTQLNRGWQKLVSRSLAGLASLGLENAEFLRNVEPSEQVRDLFWKQFVIDYSLAVFQIPLYGARANLADPDALAAQENGILGLWTGRGHRFDMLDQVRGYQMDVPARYVLDYQRSQVQDKHEDAYDPVEATAWAGPARSETFWRSLGQMTKNASNVYEGDYGHFAWKSFKNRLRVLQSSFVLSMIARTLFAHQAFDNALGGFAFTYITGFWMYSWMWPVFNQGQSGAAKKLKRKNAQLEEAKVLLARGLRLKQMDDVGAGIKLLGDIYDEHANQDISKQFDELNSNLLGDFLAVTSSRGTFTDGLARNAALEAIVSEALSTGKDETVRRAKDALVDAYEGTMPLSADAKEHLFRLNALSLLEYIRANPPFPTRLSRFAEWTFTTVAAVSTTALATMLFVYSFREGTPWSERILEGAGAAGALYFGAYKAQDKINDFFDRRKSKREARAAGARCAGAVAH